MLARLKQLLKERRLLWTILRRLGLSRSPKVKTAEYWEGRYARGGNSGAGSYNRLAEFKAEVINGFVRKHKVCSVLELGSGDGAQLDLAEYPQYIGFDVARTAVAIAAKRHPDRPNCHFKHISELTPSDQADLALSLDVLFHLVEDEVFSTHLNQLFSSGKRWVIIYSSNYDLPYVAGLHVRHRNFLSIVSEQFPQFRLIERVANRYPYDPADPDNTSFADFYVFERILAAKPG